MKKQRDPGTVSKLWNVHFLPFSPASNPYQVSFPHTINGNWQCEQRITSTSNSNLKTRFFIKKSTWKHWISFYSHFYYYFSYFYAIDFNHHRVIIEWFFLLLPLIFIFRFIPWTANKFRTSLHTFFFISIIQHSTSAHINNNKRCCEMYEEKK